jgi:urease accessory protein
MTKTNQKTSKVFTGMQGLAHLELEADEHSKTFIKNLKVKPPLLIQKAMYHEPSMPKAAQIYIMSSAGGILQGDKLKIDIIARKKTNAYITTQAATKIYKSENQYALQQIDVLLEKDSYLEFLPKQIIPHKSAQFKQEVNFTIDDDATLLYSETISAGRIAHGEKFDFESLIFRLNAYDSSKKILFSEAINIEPQNKKEEFEKLFGNNILYSSIYIISKASNSENLDSHIFQILKTKPIMSCSQLPNNSGIVVRILSNSNDEISDVISEIKQLVRKHLCKSQLNLAH